MTQSGAQVISADWTLLDGRLVAGARVAVDTHGRIASVDSAGPVTVRLPGCALLPGLVNAHSHAFQRGLRGRGEFFPAGAGSFWSWREAMYALVDEVDEAKLESLCVQAFSEMRACGVTTVGEFHYVHHVDPDARDFLLDQAVLQAAAAVGIRLVLLQSYYETGGVGQPLRGGQRRFGTPDVGAFLAQLDRLAARLDCRTQSLGLAPHSVRAVPGGALRAVCAEAKARGMVTHIHLEEQPRELDESEQAYGRSPMEWVLEQVAVDSSFTATHATHAPAARLRRWIETGAGICLCPITEGNLGDGLADVGAMLAAGGRLCLGSDSNVRIDLFEEARWLEFVQRLRTGTRGVCVTGRGELAPRLLECLTTGGATALGVDAGEIAPGRWADFAVIDLRHPALTGWQPESALTALLLGAGGDCVRGTSVGGQWRWNEPGPPAR